MRVAPAFLAVPSPRLPARRLPTNIAPLAIAGMVHLLAATLIILAARAAPVLKVGDEPAPVQAIRVVLPPRLVFEANGRPGGGGGGGGNRQAGPIRRAEGVGRDAVTMRTMKRPPVPAPIASEPDIPPIVLDALPLASGTFNQIGLPVGGFGGGAYRPGGAVTAPRLLSQVRPHYTNDALERRIEGSVWLEVVVTREGRSGEVRVLRSLDRGGLDEEAIGAVRLWRFEPGRLAGTAVDVMVTIVMDFSIR